MQRDDETMSDARMQAMRRRSASTSIGRSACRNAPIAISTAMCAMPPSTRRASCAPCWPRSPPTPRACPAAPSTSIFFGGGTPSLMQPATVGAILDAIAARTGPVAPDVEVTLEANPTSVEATRFRGYRGAGVNRVSLGVQALDDGALKLLGPHAHRRRGARRGRDRARVFDRYSFDLIYARPGADARRPGRPSSSAHRGSGRASLALSAHHRAGHAVCRAARRAGKLTLRTTTARARSTT